MLTNDQRREVGEAARAYSLPEAHVLAVVDVESDGKIFATVEGRQEPVILFEPHILYRRLAGAERNRAVAMNIASKAWNKKLYPGSQAGRWKQLLQAAAINHDAAYESASWGVGQVMGFHWKALGFDSVDQFVAQARSGLKGQVDLMLRFIRVNGLEEELRTGQWAPFARGYNGSGYKKNRYDVKLERAAATYGGAVSEPNGMLRLGSKGRRVHEMQALLIRAGFTVKEDGDFGPSTKVALQQFQKAVGITVDGVYGPKTEAALADYRQEAKDNPGHQPITKLVDVQKGVGGGLVGTVTLAGAKEALTEATYQIAATGLKSQILDYVTTGLTVAATICAIAGLGYAAWGWMKSKRTIEA